jgi:hypothetical protein
MRKDNMGIEIHAPHDKPKIAKGVFCVLAGRSACWVGFIVSEELMFMKILNLP